MRVRLAKEGWIFLGGMVVILVIAMSYVNNLAFLFSFFLLAASLLSGVIAYTQLRAMELLRLEFSPAAAGDSIQVRATFRNLQQFDPSVADATCLQVEEVQQLAKGNTSLKQNARSRSFFAAPGSTGTAEFSLRLPARGKYRISELLLSTSFPLGIFSVSRKIPVATTFYVYPKARGNLPFPTTRIGAFGDGEIGTGLGEDFSGHRLHNRGESERRVDWKIFAKRNQKILKEFQGGADATLLFRSSDLQGLKEEDKVSQLAAWCERALQNNFTWSLDLNGNLVPPAHGSAHYHRCLELLAVYRELDL